MNELKNLPPHNIEAEQALLGSLLLDKDAYIKIDGMIEPLDFYVTKNQKLFKEMQKVDVIDITTLKGGAGYLASLINSVPFVSNVVHYASIVKKLSVRRNMLLIANQLIESIHNEEEDDEVDRLKEKLLDVRGDTTIQAKGIKELITKYFEDYESDIKMGITSGLPTLDSMTTGWRGGNVITIMAKSGVGKTNMCIDFTLEAIKQSKKVMYITMEMSENELLDRFIAKYSEIDAHSIRSHLASPEDISKALDYFNDKDLKILYTSDISTSQIMSLAYITQKKEGLDMIVIDSLDLVSEYRIKGENEDTNITRKMRKLKQMATKLNIPVFTPWQIDKFSARNGGTPQLEDGKGSTAVGHNSDIVLFIRLNEDSAATTEDGTLFITKHRAGRKGEIKIYFNKGSLKFLE